VTLSKPFHERIRSLLSLVFFDPSVFTTSQAKQAEQRQENAQHAAYFDQFFVSNKRAQTNTNLSLRVQCISLYLPLMYHRESDMVHTSNKYDSCSST
jgi:hypothetical protein